MDCFTNKTIAWVVGNRDAKTFKKLYEKLKHLKKAIFYTDDWKVYAEILPKERHVIGKGYTVGIERNNSNVRHHLGRMTRRTKVVSKSKEMIDLTMKLHWHVNENGGFDVLQKSVLSIFS